jgi:hypothetical protein
MVYLGTNNGKSALILRISDKVVKGYVKTTSAILKGSSSLDYDIGGRLPKFIYDGYKRWRSAFYMLKDELDAIQHE